MPPAPQCSVQTYLRGQKIPPKLQGRLLRAEEGTLGIELVQIRRISLTMPVARDSLCLGQCLLLLIDLIHLASNAVDQNELILDLGDCSDHRCLVTNQSQFTACLADLHLGS